MIELVLLSPNKLLHLDIPNVLALHLARVWLSTKIGLVQILQRAFLTHPRLRKIIWVEGVTPHCIGVLIKRIHLYWIGHLMVIVVECPLALHHVVDPVAGGRLA